jgi:hypothetical protein
MMALSGNRLLQCFVDGKAMPLSFFGDRFML